MSARLPEVRTRMAAAAAMARLPLRSGRWSGQSGVVAGLGTGSSLDFQDQRSYLPGDDPRHINWQAYARTGSYTMKLYRQEVSPRVDLLVDLSPSMFTGDAKAARSWELVYWAVESALRWGAALKVISLNQNRCSEVPMAEVMACEWTLPKPNAPGSEMPVLDRAPLRPGSLRVLVSDLLFPGPPEALTVVLAQSQGRGVLLCPGSREEEHPPWVGNVEFEDCESALLDRRRVTPQVLERYSEAYRRHFALWREQCQRLGLAFARVAAEGDFLTALRMEGVATGAVELS